MRRWKNMQRKCRNYRRAGRMFAQCIPLNRAAPEIRATCCRCEGLCFVREQAHAPEGTTLVPCYGCIREEVEAERRT